MFYIKNWIIYQTNFVLQKIINLIKNNYINQQYKRENVHVYFKLSNSNTGVFSCWPKQVSQNVTRGLGQESRSLYIRCQTSLDHTEQRTQTSDIQWTWGQGWQWLSLFWQQNCKTDLEWWGSLKHQSGPTVLGWDTEIQSVTLIQIPLMNWTRKNKRTTRENSNIKRLQLKYLAEIEANNSLLFLYV